MRTTCPLDCYDACSVRYNNNKLKGDKEHPYTKGYLCPSLHEYLETPRITNARYEGKDINMELAKIILTQKLKKFKDKKTLYFKGTGNFGHLQNITGEFFSKYGSTFTKGSLCDSAGVAGIEAGRGKNYILTPNEIAKSEVVVVWGRNIENTNSHLLDTIKNKILIVIDPIKTSLAKKAHIHLQIPPRSDFYLALLFCRFAYMEQMDDEEYIKKHCLDFDYFLDFFRSYTINQLLDETEVVIKDFLTALMLIKDSKTAFLVGNGVQKYTNGAEVLRAIDSFVAMIGYFGKEGCGVSFLGDSKLGYKDPFVYKTKTVAKPIVNFGEYDLVFIQGANPANQMPNTNRVIKGLKNSFVVYFGLYENETSALADLVIPSCNFLEKEDVRFSYGTHFVGLMPKLKEVEYGISEYDLTNYLLEQFGYEKLEKASKYIEHIVESNSNFNNHLITSKSYKKTPYSQEDFSFKFIVESEDESDIKEQKGFWLISSKYKYSINSQFNRAKSIRVPTSLGLNNGDMVKVTSPYGQLVVDVMNDDRLRDDCILIYSGTKGVNNLTPSIKSDDGNGACFGEVKVRVEKLN
jgi:anaerobic selenocysteine-containing dehydrogenase